MTPCSSPCARSLGGSASKSTFPAAVTDIAISKGSYQGKGVMRLSDMCQKSASVKSDLGYRSLNVTIVEFSEMGLVGL